MSQITEAPTEAPTVIKDENTKINILNFIPKESSIASEIQKIDEEKENQFQKFKNGISGKRLKLRINAKRYIATDGNPQDNTESDGVASKYTVAIFPDVKNQDFRIAVTKGNAFEFFADLIKLAENKGKRALGWPQYRNGSLYISAETLRLLIGEDIADSTSKKKLKNSSTDAKEEKSTEKETEDGKEAPPKTSITWKVEGTIPETLALKEFVAQNHTRALILDHENYDENSAADNTSEERKEELKNQAKHLANIPGLRYNKKKNRWCYFDEGEGCWIYADHTIVEEQLQEREFHIEKNRELFSAIYYYTSRGPIYNRFRARQLKRFGGKPRKGGSMFIDGVDDIFSFHSPTNGNTGESAEANQGVNFSITYSALAYYVLIDGLKGTLGEISESSQKIRKIKTEIANIQKDAKAVGALNGNKAIKRGWNKKNIDERMKAQLDKLKDELSEEQAERVFKRIEAIAISGMAGGVVGHSLAEAPLVLGLKAGETSNWLEFSGTTVAAGGQLAMTIVALRDAMIDSLECLGLSEKIKLAKSSLNEEGTNKQNLGFTLDKEHQACFVAYLKGQRKKHGTTAVLNAATSTSQFLMQLAYVISAIETGGSTAGFSPKLIESARVVMLRSVGATGTVSSVFTKSILEVAYFSAVFADSDEEMAETFLDKIKQQKGKQDKVNLAKKMAEDEAIPRFICTSMYNYIEKEVAHVEKPTHFKEVQNDIANAFEPKLKERKEARKLLKDYLKGKDIDLDKLVNFAYDNFAESLKNGIPTPNGKHSFYNENTFSQPIFSQLENRKDAYKKWFKELLKCYANSASEKHKRIDALWKAKDPLNFEDDNKKEQTATSSDNKPEKAKEEEKEVKDNASGSPESYYAEKLEKIFSEIDDEEFRESFLTILLKESYSKKLRSFIEKKEYLESIKLQKDSKLEINFLILIPLYIAVMSIAIAGAIAVGVLTLPALLTSFIGEKFGFDKTNPYKWALRISLTPAIITSAVAMIALGALVITMAIPAFMVGGMLYGTNALIKTLAPKVHEKIVDIYCSTTAFAERQWVNLTTFTKNKLPLVHNTIAYPYRWITTLNIPFPWIRQSRKDDTRFSKNHLVIGNKHFGWESDKTAYHFNFKKFFDDFKKLSKKENHNKEEKKDLKKIKHLVDIIWKLSNKNMKEAAKEDRDNILKLLYEFPSKLMDQEEEKEVAPNQQLQSHLGGDHPDGQTEKSTAQPIFSNDLSMMLINEDATENNGKGATEDNSKRSIATRSSNQDTSENKGKSNAKNLGERLKKFIRNRNTTVESAFDTIYPEYTAKNLSSDKDYKWHKNVQLAWFKYDISGDVKEKGKAENLEKEWGKEKRKKLTI